MFCIHTILPPLQVRILLPQVTTTIINSRFVGEMKVKEGLKRREEEGQAFINTCLNIKYNGERDKGH